MSDTIAQLRAIKRRHDFYSRLLTVALTAVVCLIGGAFALAEVPFTRQYKTATGLAIMFAAFVFYKIPRLSYHLNRRWFARDEENLKLMGSSWAQYKLRILNQPFY